MSMRARKLSDYEGAPKLKGDHSDSMNSMFDNKGQRAEKEQTLLMTALKQNKEKYDRQLYADWIVKVYDKCNMKCVFKGHVDE